MQVLAYFILAITDIYVMHQFFSNQFEWRWRSPWKVSAGYLFLLLVNVVVPTCFPAWCMGVASVIFCCTILLLLFEGDIGAKLLTYVLLFFVGSISEFFVCVEYEMIMQRPWVGSSETEIWEWIFVVLQITLVKFFLMKLSFQFIGKEKRRLKGRWNFLLLLFPVISCFYGSDLFVLFRDGDRKIQMHVVFGLIFLVILNVIVFGVLEKMSSLLYEQKEHALFWQRNQLEKEYYGNLEEIEKRQAIYCHDMKHYMETLAELIKKEENQEVATLFEQMKSQVEGFGQSNYTGSGILNALLMAKRNQAEKHGVTMVIEFEPTADVSFIKEMDLIAMFGNLIDNAIRGASTCAKNRTVRLLLYETEAHFIVFVVENDSEDVVRKKKHTFMSTKKEAGHGIGITSVQELAGRYGGTFTLQEEDGRFLALLSLSKTFYRG